MYVNTKGPRFETRSEIRALALVGDLVGMTAAHEASAAMELKLPYAIVAVIDNVCNGLLNPHVSVMDELSLSSFHKAQAENLSTVETLVDAIITHFGASLGKAAAPAAAHLIDVDLMVHAKYVPS